MQSIMQCTFCHNTVKIPEALLTGGKRKKRGDPDAEDADEEEDIEEEKEFTEDPLIEYLEARIKNALSYTDEPISSPAGEKQPSHAWRSQSLVKVRLCRLGLRG